MLVYSKLLFGKARSLKRVLMYWKKKKTLIYRLAKYWSLINRRKIDDLPIFFWERNGILGNINVSYKPYVTDA